MAKARFARRGFVKEAEELALAYRDDLGLQPLDRLDPIALAVHLEVPLLALSSLDGCSGADHFLGTASSKFSAMLVPLGQSRKGILYNDCHAEVRIASSITHEFGHLFLGHECVQPFNNDGLRNMKAEVEKEATEVAGFLLVTTAAGLKIERDEVPLADAAEALGVSTQFLDWRLRMTVRTRVAREKQKWNR